MSVSPECTQAKRETRSAQVNMRFPAGALSVIDEAAELLSKSRTDFMLESAVREAENVLLDKRLFGLDDATYRRFCERLGEPAKLRPQLRKLLRKTPAWDR